MLVTQENLFDGFKNLGLKKGQQIIVHSSLSSFGKLEGGAKTFIEVLQEIITNTGLIVMPSFTYGYKPYNRLETPSETGYITEFFRNSKDVFRSEHPTHSICAWGKLAKEFVRGHKIESAFGIGSPLLNFYENGNVLLVGVDYTACSVIHISQEIARVDYLDRPKFVSIDGEKKQFKVRRAGCSKGFNKIKNFLEPYETTNVIGNSTLIFISSKVVVDTSVKLLNKDQFFLCCDIFDCPSCDEAKNRIL